MLLFRDFHWAPPGPPRGIVNKIFLGGNQMLFSNVLNQNMRARTRGTHSHFIAYYTGLITQAECRCKMNPSSLTCCCPSALRTRLCCSGLTHYSSQCVTEMENKRMPPDSHTSRTMLRTQRGITPNVSPCVTQACFIVIQASHQRNQDTLPTSPEPSN